MITRAFHRRSSNGTAFIEILCESSGSWADVKEISVKHAPCREGASSIITSAPNNGVTEALAMTDGSRRGPGKGSDVVVRLPVSESEPVQQNVDHRPIEHAAARRVVVIDDDRDVADSLAMLLELLGCDVRTAYSGEAGIPLVVEFRPSIIFLDLGMPDMNGYETARHIRAEPAGQQAQLVALTGWGQAADKARTREAGFDRHLVKPADIDALEELIASADEGPQG